MGIPTLIKTLTADGDSSLSFVHGTSDVVFDGTYDEYMFVLTDLNPVDNNVEFRFQVNASGQSGYNEVMTTTYFQSYHDELDGTDNAAIEYSTSHDQGNGTGGTEITGATLNGSDHSSVCIFNIFDIASTVYVKNFYAVAGVYGTYNSNVYTAGYVNVTAALIGITFDMETGNFDGVIQMYGIS
jgi:hypothetical protein